MKKLISIFLSGLAIASTTLSFQSCADEYDPAIVTRADQLKINYDEAFVKEFGEPDPNHNWGFDYKPNAVTRATNTNSNEWESIYQLVVPGGIAKTTDEYNRNGHSWTSSDVTVEEREYVYWWFSTHKNPTPIYVNWSNYFVQNVWGQPEHSRNYIKYGQYASENISKNYPGTTYGMDKLMVNKTATPTDMEDIENFNAGGTAKEQVMYKYNSTTENFSYQNSYDSNRYSRWTLQYINGNYYLAFDYEYDKGNGEKLEADGYYNDWILKLTPGVRESGAKYTRRVMCEDLGGAYDFDFDDVVFDVSTAPENGLDITIQAAGGTLPVYICYPNANYEIHKLFGMNELTPINVELNGTKRPVVALHLTAAEADALNIGYTSENVAYLENGESKNKDVRVYRAQDVPIYVKNGGNDAKELTNLSIYNGTAPDKFGCKNSTKWVLETHHIKNAYKKFESWVNDQTTLWELPAFDGDTGVDASQVNNSELYPSSGSGEDYNGVYRPNDYLDVDRHPEAIQAWSTLCQEIDWRNWSTKTKSDVSEPQTTGDFFAGQRPQYFPGDDNPNAAISLEVANNIGGSVSIKVNGETTAERTFAKGTEITLVATPTAGCAFTKWNDGNTNSERTITVTEDVTYKAEFIPTGDAVKTITNFDGLINGSNVIIDDGLSDHVGKSIYVTMTFKQVEYSTGGEYKYSNNANIGSWNINNSNTTSFWITNLQESSFYVQFYNPNLPGDLTSIEIKVVPNE